MCGHVPLATSRAVAPLHESAGRAGGRLGSCAPRNSEGLQVQAPSRRNRVIGLAGLLWFAFCGSNVLDVTLDPHGFRAWSHYSWTDRELMIGSVCWMTAGLGGLILALTRLLLPMFATRPRIADGV